MEKELQQKYLELQMLDQQIKELQKNIETVDNHISELESASQSIEEIGEVKPGTEILVPVAGGVFARTELKDNRKFIVNVGAGTTVEKSIPDTTKMITEQITEISSTREQLLGRFQQQVSRAQQLQKEVEEMQNKHQ